jgi:hypothetical protein
MASISKTDGSAAVSADNLSCNITLAIQTWAAAHRVELCLTPTTAAGPTRSRRSSGHCGCCEGRLDRVRGAQVDSVLGGEVVDREQRFERGW